MISVLIPLYGLDKSIKTKLISLGLSSVDAVRGAADLSAARDPRGVSGVQCVLLPVRRGPWGGAAQRRFAARPAAPVCGAGVYLMCTMPRCSATFTAAVRSCTPSFAKMVLR